jgi:predicted nucleotidyltransferase
MSDAQGQTKGTLDALPKAVRDRLEELKDSLARALGDDLVGLVVFGSAARGGYHEGKSDVDVAVVLREAPRDKLEAIGNAVVLARNAARIEAMILTEAEIPRASDVFPLLYDDIRSRHVVLAGRDPFAGLTISDRHRRLRVEQELREAQIRMRRAVTDAMGAPELLAGAVIRKVKQIRGPLLALLGLRGQKVDDHLDAVLKAAGAAYEVDVAPLLRPREDLARAHEALEKLLGAAVADVDRMEDGEEAR